MLRDLQWAFRGLRQNPLFAAAVTLILALGIGANTAVFSIVDAVLLRSLPFTAPDALVGIEEVVPGKAASFIPAPRYLLWQDRTDLFQATAAWSKDSLTLTSKGADPDQVMALRTTGSLFPLLGTAARLGRPLNESDDHAALLSHRLWLRRYHGDPQVVGRDLTIGSEVFTIVGVMPADFEFPEPEVEMWVPVRITPATPGSVQLIARLKPGVSLAGAQSAAQVVARQVERDYPQAKRGLQLHLAPWRETGWSKYQQTLVLILIAVGLVLLIACADVGGLLLSRAVERQKEIAIRASLGAGFGRVLRQLLAESLVLAVIGSAAGVVVARYTLLVLSRQVAALPFALPHVGRMALNGRVLLFNTVLCLLLAVVFSLAPVFLASRTDLQSVLRGGQGSGASRRAARIFSALIAAQAAFAFLLLAGSGLMIRSLIRLQRADHGLHPDHVLTMRVPIGSLTQTRPAGRYDTKPRQMAYYHDVLDRLQVVPGITAVAVVNNLPLSNVNTAVNIPGPDGQPMTVRARTISAQYFTVMGIPLVAGHAFSDADQGGSPPVAIVNEYLAHVLYPDRSAVGQPLIEPGSGPPTTIVGVARNAAQMSYEQPPTAELYRPYRQLIFGTFMSTIVARTAGDPLSMASALRKAVWAVDPDQPILKIETMDDVIADSIWRPRFSAWVFSILGGLALLLTSAGVYGVVAYTTALKAREVGIRVALGATPRHVVANVLRNAMLPLAAGLAISIGAALLLSRLVAALLYDTSASDPATYLFATVVLLVIGALASARPAWKAAQADPLTTLRL